MCVAGLVRIVCMFADDGWIVRSDERTLKAIYEKAIKNLLLNLLFVTYTVIYRIQPAMKY